MDNDRKTYQPLENNEKSEGALFDDAARLTNGMSYLEVKQAYECLKAEQEKKALELDVIKRNMERLLQRKTVLESQMNKQESGI